MVTDGWNKLNRNVVEAGTNEVSNGDLIDLWMTREGGDEQTTQTTKCTSPSNLF